MRKPAARDFAGAADSLRHGGRRDAGAGEPTPPRHYYVAPADGYEGRCRRHDCRRPQEHPIHLKPPRP